MGMTSGCPGAYTCIFGFGAISTTSETCPPAATVAADVEVETLKWRVVIGSAGNTGASASIHAIDAMSGFVMRVAIVHKKGEPQWLPLIDLPTHGTTIVVA